MTTEMSSSSYQQSEPFRLCIACRQSAPRNGLLRLTRCHLSGKVLLHSNRAVFGRSVYIHSTESCIQEALKSRAKSLGRALKCPVPDAIVEALKQQSKEKVTRVDL